MKHFRLSLFIASGLGAANLGAQTAPDHVVIVIMENHSFGQIIGSSEAPAINALAAAGANIVADATDPSASRSGSHALRHPSQPNYLELYSGDNQGTLQDGYPGSSSEPAAATPPFATPNLGASLLHAGYTFATYSESLPAVGSNVEAFSDDAALTKYERKHNPAVNWQADDASPANTHLPPALNQPFFPISPGDGSGFPSDFTKLPTVAIVVPNQQHDMHDGSIAEGDAWLKANIIDTYGEWAKTHNSLLIVTFDEDGDNTASNQITTIFAGPMIKPGAYPETDLNIGNPDVRAPSGLITPTGTAMNHYNVLATVEDLYGLAHIGGSANRPPVSDIFASALSVKPLIAPNRLAGKQGDAGNLFPLFSAKPIRYQQVFASSDFARFPAGGEVINSIAFRAHAPGGTFTGSVPQLQVNLSTTAKAPDGLSSTFAENVGADDVQVFSGPLQVTVTNSSDPNAINSFDVLISFSTPFPYDPSKGNLLLDIRNTQGGTETPDDAQELDGSVASGDTVSRVFNYGDVTAAGAGQTGGADENDSFGLVTQFGTTANPAPTPVPTPTPPASPTPTPTATPSPTATPTASPSPTTSPSASPTATPTAIQLVNISARASVETGERVNIGGFIVQGAVPKRVLLRGIGPSLRAGDAPVAGALQDPVIELHDSSGALVETNDNWKDSPEAPLISASGIPPSDDRESAIERELTAGNYTVVLRGANETTGIGLVEIFDLDSVSDARLGNLSARAYVRTGDDVLIGGVIIRGGEPQRILVRGIGPSLTSMGLASPVLDDPTLELRSENGDLMLADDNWKETQQADIAATGLAPNDDREPAILMTLSAGNYTAIVRGKDGGTGIALVEAYRLD